MTVTARRPPAYLGIDVGTSGVKVALVRADGRLLASSEDGYELSTPRPGWAESDPATWLSSLGTAIDRIAPDVVGVDVAGIGIAGQMHGAVLCDDTGVPIAPAILWPDRRAEREVERWQRLPPDLFRALANPPVPGMTGPMVAWLAAHRRDLVDRAAAVLHVKDVVRTALLSGSTRPVTDRSDASATLLWDVAGERWAVDVCTATDVPARLLPEVVGSTHIVGPSGWLGNRVAGTSADVPVVAGAGDTPAALLAIQPPGLQINFGTGIQLLRRRGVPDRGAADPSTHLYADAADGWYAMAALQNGGLALEWAARVLGLTWDELMTAAARRRAGSVSFLPFLTGERGGVATASSTGGWLGLGVDTTRDDLARAAVEGVVFAIRRAAELLDDDMTTPVTLSGGGWRSPVLLRLVADALARPVRRVDVRSASATGAAMLAASGTGTSLTPIATSGEPENPRPSPAGDAAYQRWLTRCPASDL